MGFEPATPRIPRQRSTTCAISVVATCYLNVIDEPVNMYSAETIFKPKLCFKATSNLIYKLRV